MNSTPTSVSYTHLDVYKRQPEGRLAGWHGGRRGFEQDAAWDLRFPQAGVQIPDLPVHTGQNFNGLNIWHWDWGGIPLEDDKTDDGQVATFAAEFLTQKQKKPCLLYTSRCL